MPLPRGPFDCSDQYIRRIHGNHWGSQVIHLMTNRRLLRIVRKLY